jgi:hypothetical protein
LVIAVIRVSRPAIATGSRPNDCIRKSRTHAFDPQQSAAHADSTAESRLSRPEVRALLEVDKDALGLPNQLSRTGL